MGSIKADSMRIDDQTVMSLLGPRGVKQRMDELQSRIDALSPNPRSAFQGVLEQNMPGPMSFLSAQEPGLIGNQYNINGDTGYDAYSPFGAGNTLKGTDELKTLIAKAAKDNGIEPELLDAIVQAESNYNPMAVSSAGARGLTQLRPFTAAGLGVKNIHDPLENLNGGAKYIAEQLKSFGNLRDALAAYNAGPGRFRKGGVLPLQTTRYVDKVMKLYEANKNK